LFRTYPQFQKGAADEILQSFLRGMRPLRAMPKNHQNVRKLLRDAQRENHGQNTQRPNRLLQPERAYPDI
jgi:hypothetical protein